MVNDEEVSKLTKNKNSIPNIFLNRFDVYPENRRRPVNKTLYKNKYFNLVYKINQKSLDIVSQGDIVYSAIPHDKGRKYIQMAAVQFILNPIEAEYYIRRHKVNLETYLMLGIFQLTGKRMASNSTQVQKAYDEIFKDTLFEIQIMGRLLQHDETGPLSANLAGKFIYSENLKSGVLEYLSEYLKFVIEITSTLPIFTDGYKTALIDDDRIEKERNKIIEFSFSGKSNITKGIALMPQDIKDTLYEITHERDIKLEINNDVNKLGYLNRELTLKDKKNINQNNNELIVKEKFNTSENPKKPILKSERGKELRNVRENYIAHSVDPKRIGKYFENVLPTDNENMINVVSDIHSQNNELPLHNSNFNVLVGDISESQVKNTELNGIYVLGNWELIDVLKDKEVLRDQKWDSFRMEKYFRQLILEPASSWPFLPLDTTENETNFYNNIAERLALRFPKMKILNNENYVYDGVRYIGITLPVELTRRKKEVQEYIVQKLKILLEDDRKTPTVIVSHAPLFNELSMLSPKSKAYNRNYTCENPGIIEIFKKFNILGAIHGHHHIPASSGRSKKVQFAGKELFVVCSIYSSINTGFELNNLL